jgi:hypothetical protein
MAANPLGSRYSATAQPVSCSVVLEAKTTQKKISSKHV